MITANNTELEIMIDANKTGDAARAKADLLREEKTEKEQLIEKAGKILEKTGYRK